MAIAAAIQMCSTLNVDDNLRAAEKLIAMAAEQGAKFIVLPENFAIMGLNDADRYSARESFGSGKIQDFLSHQASQHQAWLVGGTIPMDCKNEKRVRAASLLFDASGNCVARYDKIHLFDVDVTATETYRESDGIQAGDGIVVVETPFGKVGMAVCYDIRFPELFRCMFNAGADIFVLPSAFTVITGTAHWEVLLRSRAVENFCYVIGAGQGGLHTNGRRTYGHSLIVSPWGEKLAELPGTDSGVICADMDLKKLREIRQSLPVARHQRIFFDVRELALSRSGKVG